MNRSPVIADVPDLLLSESELLALTGYKRAAEQLEELHRLGFARARRDRFGRVILERAHYDAVVKGAVVSARPRVRKMRETA